DLERAEATARSAQAEYDLQRIRLERTTVRAPFAGVVGQRYVSVGDYVTTSTRLASLHTVNPQRAAFQVPERFARLLRPGQEVTFRVAAIPGHDFSGTVDFVDPVVQLPGRTILVKARVPNSERLLQPGMFIEAHLVTAVRPKAIVIPEDAVVPVQGTNLVWVVKDGKAAQQPVSLGVRTSGFVVVTSGVEVGTQVVVRGLELLAPGAPVMAKVVDRGSGGGDRELAGEAGAWLAGVGVAHVQCPQRDYRDVVDHRHHEAECQRLHACREAHAHGDEDVHGVPRVLECVPEPHRRGEPRQAEGER